MRDLFLYRKVDQGKVTCNYNCQHSSTTWEKIFVTVYETQVVPVMYGEQQVGTTNQQFAADLYGNKYQQVVHYDDVSSWRCENNNSHYTTRPYGEVKLDRDGKLLDTEN